MLEMDEAVKSTYFIKHDISETFQISSRRVKRLFSDALASIESQGLILRRSHSKTHAIIPSPVSV